MDEIATPKRDAAELVIRVCIGILCGIGGLGVGLLVGAGERGTDNLLHDVSDSPSIVATIELEPPRVGDDGTESHHVRLNDVRVSDLSSGGTGTSFFFDHAGPLSVSGLSVERGGRMLGGAQVFDDLGNRYLLMPIEGEPPVRVVVGLLDD